MTYQPVWRDGRVVSGGGRDCADRYAMIKQVLSELKPNFTMLDIGANRGYFSVRTSEDFPQCRIMAVDRLPELKVIASPQISVAERTITVPELIGLPRVDVVLSLSVLHHFKDWRGALKAMRQCREWLIIEVPHPDEKWMRKSASRTSVAEIHREVKALSVETLGVSERTSPKGEAFLRPVFLVPGTVRQTTARAFSGSGSNSKKMPAFSNGLDKRLGYQPVPGSLNLRMNHEVTWAEPLVDWVGRSGRKTRDYQLWDGWVRKSKVHAMIPGSRGHGPNTIEVVASHNLRGRYRIEDGDTVELDYEPTDKTLTMRDGIRHYTMWRYPGKIAKCMEAGFPYEKTLLRYMKKRKFRGLAVDAGANLGNHTMWLAAMCGMRVAAFEPIKVTELVENVRINRHLRDRIDVYPVALGESDAPAKHVGKGRLVSGGSLPVRTLDSYGLTNVSVIKADVEGMEPAVLRGGEQTIRRDLPAIFAECWDEKAKSVINDILVPWGYKHIWDFRHGKGGTVVGLWETGRE